MEKEALKWEHGGPGIEKRTSSNCKADVESLKSGRLATETSGNGQSWETGRHGKKDVYTWG